MWLRRFLLALVIALLPWSAMAAEPSPAQASESVRSLLVQAQLILTNDPAQAQSLLNQAQALYDQALAKDLTNLAPQQATEIATRWPDLAQALEKQDVAGFAQQRALLWTHLLKASYGIVGQAIDIGKPDQALQWLPVREFRNATRFSRPNGDAARAIEQWKQATYSAVDARTALDADLLDTYQAKLNESLRTLRSAAQKGNLIQQAEAGAAIQGYFAILEPAYRSQHPEQIDAALANAENLRQAALSNNQLETAITSFEGSLSGFRAAPLSPAEQVRRAGQLRRFLSLVPVEYERGVRNGQVTLDLEIQEATTFRNGAAAAFSDLESLLIAIDPSKTQQVASDLRELETMLTAAAQRTSVAEPDAVQAKVDHITTTLAEIMPAEWQKSSLEGDFDVIASMLDQMENAVAGDQYDLAESARLEAYAVLESGPEARLIVFAPEYKAPIENLFWYGKDEFTGLAELIRQKASLSDIRASRQALDKQLDLAQDALGGSSTPEAVATSAAVIVFREGLEAVLILASLLASLKIGEQRGYRKPIWIGAALAMLATVLTWVLARGLITELIRRGDQEKIEAIVSLIAIAVLLLITNWFFHKVYWTGWMANFHAQKRRIIGGKAGLWLGLITLGFTSIYREGVETVLFLQALVLEASTQVVLAGVAMGLGGTALVGVLVFGLQAKLPHKKMLIVTGVMIGAVLLIMVGNTMHIMQLVGWMPLHPIRSLEIPYWANMWLGFYATWEGIAAQVAAGAFVIGSYVIAEHLQHRKTEVAVKRQSATAK